MSRRCILLTRGTGAAGLKQLRASEDGVYGPGIYFYAGPGWRGARSYAERGGGVIVAIARAENVDYHRIVERDRDLIGRQFRRDIAVVSDPSHVKVLGVVPTEQTLDHREFEYAVKRIARRARGYCPSR